MICLFSLHLPMNKIPNNSQQGPAASAASGVNKIGFWPAKDCLLMFWDLYYSWLLVGLLIFREPCAKFRAKMAICSRSQSMESSLQARVSIGNSISSLPVCVSLSLSLSLPLSVCLPACSPLFPFASGKAFLIWLWNKRPHNNTLPFRPNSIWEGCLLPSQMALLLATSR